MTWKITEKESRPILILKLLYVIPILILGYIPAVILTGIQELGSPATFIKEIKGVWNKSKNSW